MDDDGTCHGVLTRSIATVVPRAWARKWTDIGALFHAFYLFSSLFGIIFFREGKKVGAWCIKFLFRAKKERKKWLGFYPRVLSTASGRQLYLIPNQRNATLFPMKKEKKKKKKKEKHSMCHSYVCPGSFSNANQFVNILGIQTLNKYLSCILLYYIYIPEFCLFSDAGIRK